MRYIQHPELVFFTEIVKNMNECDFVNVCMQCSIFEKILNVSEIYQASLELILNSIRINFQNFGTLQIDSFDLFIYL